MNDVVKIFMCLISFVLITQTTSAKEYLYTCVSENKNSFHIKEGQVWKLGDKRWILVFVINTDEQSVYEKYAGELGGKETEIFEMWPPKMEELPPLLRPYDVHQSTTLLYLSVKSTLMMR